MSLSGDVKTRYLHKIGLVGGTDPYEISKKDWSHDKSRWPELDYFDMVNYQVYSLSHYIIDEMRSYKSLDSYNYFVHGWVHDVSDVIINKLHVMTARVSYLAGYRFVIIMTFMTWRMTLLLVRCCYPGRVIVNVKFNMLH